MPVLMGLVSHLHKVCLRVSEGMSFVQAVL